MPRHTARAAVQDPETERQQVADIKVRRLDPAAE
jgi:hypothetical protein